MKVVAAIEREQALVNANKQLIRLFGQKIKDRIAAMWGKTLGVEEMGVVPMSYASVDGELVIVLEE